MFRLWSFSRYIFFLLLSKLVVLEIILFFISCVNFPMTPFPSPNVPNEKLVYFYLLFLWKIHTFMQCISIISLTISLPPFSRTAYHLSFKFTSSVYLFIFNVLTYRIQLMLTKYNHGVINWGMDNSSDHTLKEKCLFLTPQPQAINCQIESELGIKPQKTLPDSSHYFF